MNIIKKEQMFFLISETKIDNRFPTSQFTTTGYSIPFRLDRKSHGGGVLCLSQKILKLTAMLTLRGFWEISLRKKKWLLCCSYNPEKSNIAKHLKNICMTLKKLSATYENLILLGDLNVEDQSIVEFLNLKI